MWIKKYETLYNKLKKIDWYNIESKMWMNILHNREILNKLDLLDLTISEVTFWIRNNKSTSYKYSFCPHCGKHKNTFSDTCGNTTCVGKQIEKVFIEKYGVSNISQLPETKEKVTKTALINFGVSNVSKSEIVKNRIVQTNLERLGVKYARQSKKVLKKSEENYLHKTGYTHQFKDPKVKKKIRKTLLENYGVDNISKNEDIKIKKFTTMRINDTYRKSEPEDRVYRLLKRHFSVYRQYSSNVYPFNCDFYLPKFDLYIEYQGSWAHGYHPFNSKSKEDLQRLRTMKRKKSEYYIKAIKTWTVSDPLKRKVSDKNNVRLLEFWSVEDVINWLNVNKNRKRFSRYMLYFQSNCTCK